MKAIILAAGQGTRLMPLTAEKPKCMIEYNGKPIIDHILNTMLDSGISDISIVAGYKKERLFKHCSGRNIKFYSNEHFSSTNMVYSLFCAENEFTDDVIISYSDIVYNSSVSDTLMVSNAPISVIADKQWLKLWELRMENPLDDAESLKLDGHNNIIEIGKKTKTYSDIQGQYIGLIKIKKEAIGKVKQFYYSLDKLKLYDGKDFNNMFMTTFIQLIIDNLMPVKAVFIKGNWLEIDSHSDLSAYEKNNIRI